jgi:hypothetical protein
MTRAEILEELKGLSLADRLAIIDAAVQLIRHDLGQESLLSSQAELDAQLAAAAAALYKDYLPGGELTVFTALDAEDFHDYEAG